ncbi:MAG: hypothetical protein UV73_C0008G0022 [Candidatus Gottesmanbacteria bacterium GW2011_GWA2_43_14]|uniref:Nucleoside 2-deoxyribosyltransferase n=1 Tax=Candidatus Gottesmanbacteria bacterium GW2011_GWA2_43_14 TaxID=1618443 RepID=A0A0G1DIS8_9BACT|nr:MAG: hypothetical protein UV73_C0008G0022 [Candidatus Gottesmanbacteria bacterium GW2011_GWA2_43_14]
MKAYFLASDNKKYRDNYLRILKILRKEKITITGQNNFSEYNSNSKNPATGFLSAEQDILQADVMIAETSLPSVNAGIQIALASSGNKPVLILYSHGQAPTIANKYSNGLISCRKYNEHNLAEIIRKFIAGNDKTGSKCFNFFIPNRLAAFLERAAGRKNQSKSVYLRQLIEKEMKTG